MKKLLLLIIVQTLFKSGFTQVKDTVIIEVDSIAFTIPYQLKQGMVVLQPQKLEQITWLLTSLNTSLMDYEALVLQYSIQDSIQDHQKTLLQQALNTQNTHLNDKEATIGELDEMLETCTSAVDLMLEQQKSSRKKNSFRLLGGVAGGVLLGFGVGFLCGL